MRLLIYLNEVFKKKIPVKTYSSQISFEARFTVDDEEWMFIAKDEMFTDDWSVFFTRVNTNPKDPWSLTGDVGPKTFEVFAGLGESLKKFIKDKKPEYFHFNAEGASRIKLYKKIAKLIERKSGYEHITTKTLGKSVIFYFAK